MMTISRVEYISLQDKTFENVLTNLFRTEFGFLGGPAVIKLMVDRISELVEIYHPKMERLRFGQMLWFAIDKDENQAQHVGMKSMKLKPVILSLVTPSDIQDYINDVPQTKIVRNVMVRLFKESYDQGGVLAEHDVATILHRSSSSISNYFRDYQKETKELLPSRGVIHDIGGAVTHKEIIVTEYMSGRESPEISRDVNHSIKASDSYIKHANQIRAALKYGIAPEEISHVTGISRRLVEVYTNLLEKIARAQEKKSGG